MLNRTDSRGSGNGEPSAAELHLERALREQAPFERAPQSGSIHGAVMSRLHAGESGRSRALRVRFGVLIPAAAAAGLALAWVALPGRSTSGSPPELGIASSFDFTPVVRPAGRLVAGTIDRPLMQEASLIARDTRRAMRLVVDSLPRPGLPPATSPGGG